MRVLALLSLGIVELFGCTLNNAPPSQGQRPSTVESFVRARALDDTQLTLGQMGLNQFVFDYSMPENAQCTVWLKTYVDGKLNRHFCRIKICRPAAGNRLSGQILFNRYDPSVVTEGNSTRTKWHFAMDRVWSSDWVDDPFKKTDEEMRLHYDHTNLQFGQTYTVGCIVGAKKDDHGSIYLTGEGGEAAIAAKNAVAVFIKLRLDLIDTPEGHPSSEGIAGQVPDFDNDPDPARNTNALPK